MFLATVVAIRLRVLRYRLGPKQLKTGTITVSPFSRTDSPAYPRAIPIRILPTRSVSICPVGGLTSTFAQQATHGGTRPPNLLPIAFRIRFWATLDRHPCFAKQLLLSLRDVDRIHLGKVSSWIFHTLPLVIHKFWSRDWFLESDEVHRRLRLRVGNALGVG